MSQLNLQTIEHLLLHLPTFLKFQKFQKIPSLKRKDYINCAAPSEYRILLVIYLIYVSWRLCIHSFYVCLSVYVWLISEFRLVLVQNSNFDCKFISVRKSIMYAYLCFQAAFPKHLQCSGTSQGSQLMSCVHCLVPGLKLHLLPAFLCYFNLIKIYAPSYTLLLSSLLLQPANSILPLPLSFCE